MADLEKITKKRLGELLVAEGMITHDQLAEALKVQERTGELLGEALVKAGYTTETEIAKTLCTQFAKPFLKPSKYDISKDVMSLVPPKLMAEHQFVPVDRFGNLVVIAMAGLLDAATLAQIQKLTNCEVEVYIATASDVKLALRKTFPDLYDPITLLPKFDMTAALTQGVKPVPMESVPEKTAATPTPGRPSPLARPGATAARGNKGFGPGSGESTSEMTLRGAEDESDWEALFEEAEKNVLQTLEDDGPPPPHAPPPAPRPTIPPPTPLPKPPAQPQKKR